MKEPTNTPKKTLHTSGVKESTGLSSTLVACQPILKKNHDIWGYEVLFRNANESSHDTANHTDDILATRSVLSDGLELIYPFLLSKQRLLVNFPGELLEDGTVKLLPPHIGVIEILETVQPTPGLLEALAELKSLGYRIALDDFVGQEELLPFIPYVDLVKFEVLNSSYAKLKNLVKDILRIKKVLLLAEKIEDEETLEMCRELGFHIFQGYYFAKPELRRGKKINPSEMAKLRLISMLNDPNFKINEVSKIIETDASLSLKLLRYLNSAAIGLRTRIESINRSISILGSEHLIQWLTAVIMSQLASDNLSRQVAMKAATLGFFLNHLAKINNASLSIKQISPAGSFLFGLLISIKPLLGQSFDEIIANLPINNAIIQTLLKGEGEYALWIPLLEGYQRNDLTTIQVFSQKHQVPKQKLNQAYFNSQTIVHNIFEEL